MENNPQHFMNFLAVVLHCFDEDRVNEVVLHYPIDRVLEEDGEITLDHLQFRQFMLRDKVQQGFLSQFESAIGW